MILSIHKRVTNRSDTDCVRDVPDREIRIRPIGNRKWVTWPGLVSVTDAAPRNQQTINKRSLTKLKGLLESCASKIAADSKLCQVTWEWQRDGENFYTAREWAFCRILRPSYSAAQNRPLAALSLTRKYGSGPATLAAKEQLGERRAKSSPPSTSNLSLGPGRVAPRGKASKKARRICQTDVVWALLIHGVTSD